MAQHSLTLDHPIDFKNAKLIWKSENIHKRRIVESVVMNSVDTFQGNKPFISECRMIYGPICDSLNINIKDINVCPLQTPTNHQPAPHPQQNTEEDHNIHRGSQPQMPHNGRPPEQHLRRSARIRERSLQLPH